MANPAKRFGRLEVRCACGEGFQNSDMYLRHKRLCGTHEDDNGAKSRFRTANRRAATATAGISSPKPVVCSGDRTFKPYYTLQNHGRHYSMHEQKTNAQSADSNPTQVVDSHLDADSVSMARGHSILPAEPIARRIQCPCGQSFANENALNKHIRYSKRHQEEQPRSASKYKSTVPGPMPFTDRHSPSTSIPPGSDPVPGTIPSSALSTASLIQCTCGHAFETQRILNLHKRDSLYHKRQSDQPVTQDEPWDDSLISSFASLNLQPASTRPRPSIARFTCICGLNFTNLKTLEQHKREAARRAWQGKKDEGKEKMFKTPRPQNKEDEYLRDPAAVYAQQYRDK
ncbi:hypothetical protein J1614_011309 [Plenodomus biglobosus]|nr:hypothetical protein J1614_011309 [Plenodomus biglobosus]